MLKPLIYKPSREKELVFQAIKDLSCGYRVAMLTLVDIEGNAPYPVGSQMLVRDDGEFVGQITGGCAEQSLVQQALTVINKGANTIERYGLNSRYFDIQLPCGSGLDIKFDVERDLQYYQSIAKALEQRRSIKIDEEKNYYPTPRLLLFGQNPIIDSLLDIAPQAGFEVLYFKYEKVAAIAKYYDQFSALVSLFHEHDLELDILESALNSDLFYIGALGSKRTHTNRLETLMTRGVSESDLAKIHGPVGLDIGAITPSQIAISIIAQVILTMNSDQVYGK